MDDNVIVSKSFDFALRVVNLYKYLKEEKAEFVMSKQVLRSGTSIGANVREAEQAQSRPDFINKMNIALKEASETEYWLELLYRSGFVEEAHYQSIMADCNEINRILISIVKTTKNN